MANPELEDVTISFLNGQLSRRQMLGRLVALGISIPAALAFIEACSPSSSSSTPNPAGNPNAKITVAISSFNNESTAVWQGSGGMFPYISPMYDPLINSSPGGELTKDGLVSDWQ